MKRGFVELFALFLICLSACEGEDKHITDNKGTVKGSIGLYQGNCMPVIVCEPSPISTTVAVTEPSENFNMDILIDSVVSEADGTFELSLPPGNYSLFLRDTNGFVCDWWGCPEDCYCTYFTVKEDSTTIINANIDHASW